jgi:hypothetical protein
MIGLENEADLPTYLAHALDAAMVRTRDRAAGLPEGRERDACVTIAEGYEKLAILTAPRSMIGREKPAST